MEYRLEWATPARLWILSAPSWPNRASHKGVNLAHTLSFPPQVVVWLLVTTLPLTAAWSNLTRHFRRSYESLGWCLVPSFTTVQDRHITVDHVLLLAWENGQRWRMSHFPSFDEWCLLIITMLYYTPFYCCQANMVGPASPSCIWCHHLIGGDECRCALDAVIWNRTCSYSPGVRFFEFYVNSTIRLMLRRNSIRHSSTSHIPISRQEVLYTTTS